MTISLVASGAITMSYENLGMLSLTVVEFCLSCRVLVEVSNLTRSGETLNTCTSALTRSSFYTTVVN